MSLMPVVPHSLPVEVTLSGAQISAVKLNATAEAAVRIGADGNVYRRINFGANVQISVETDWVRPVSKAPGLYECRYTNHSGSGVSATKAEDVWHVLSTSLFEVSIQRSSFGTSSASFLLQIRLNGGPVLASANYDLSATYEDLQ